MSEGQCESTITQEGTTNVRRCVGARGHDGIHSNGFEAWITGPKFNANQTVYEIIAEALAGENAKKEAGSV